MYHVGNPVEYRPGKYRCLVAVAGSRSWGPTAPTARAAQKAAELMAQVAAVGALTVKDAIEQYGAYQLEIRGNRRQSVATSLTVLRCFFAPVLGDMLLRLTPERCAKLYEKLRTTPRERTGALPSVDTHRNYLAQARSLLRWCVEEKRWLKSNPLAEVKGAGRRRHGKQQLRIDEGRRLRAKCHELACDGDDGAVAVLIAMLMGLRASEIVSRTVRDLDDCGRVLWVDDTSTFMTKTAASRRPVPVHDELREYLLARCEAKGPHRLIFEASKGSGQHWRDWVREQTERICKLAAVPVVCAHSLRGFSATASLLAGMPLHQVAAQLGHESVSTTLQSYAAPGAAEATRQRAALQVLNGGRAAG